MRHLGVLFFATLLSAACASNPPPPPEASSETVAQATNQPHVGPDFAPVSNDGVATARTSGTDTALGTGTTTGTTATSTSGGVNPSNGVSPSTGVNPANNRSGNEGSASNDTGSGNAAAAPMDSPRTAVAPDNTRINSRDANGGKALTPMDQGPSEADRKLTQQIREAVMKDKSLSFTAKNVKIITINGKVTLRGPVKSEAERTAIEAAARRVAGNGALVDSQLELAR